MLMADTEKSPLKAIGELFTSEHVLQKRFISASWVAFNTLWILSSFIFMRLGWDRSCDPPTTGLLQLGGRRETSSALLALYRFITFYGFLSGVDWCWHVLF